MTIEDLARIVATKKDLEEFATKKDLEDLAGMIKRNVVDVMPTKDDAKNFATKDDFKIVLQRIDDVEARMATKDDLDGVEERLSNELATHDQIETTAIADLQRRMKTVEKHIFGKTA